MNLKDNKGITMIALTLTIILLFVITSATIFATKNSISIKRVQNLRTDIEALNAKIDDYYLKYGDLPALCDYCNKEQFEALIQKRCRDTGSVQGQQENSNDGDNYVVIDLEKLGGLTLNYGYDKKGEYRSVKQTGTISSGDNMEDELYVINTRTHQIYFPHGVFMDKVMHYTT